ncbi:UPF0291 protein [Siminovitchia terrae]|uniref:UPF0291 protein D5F11_020835 n=1 Tax=Siminovitchia terrae TaxID=1914933 RepID=A0A429X376_SIMTE|nr:DUF896 domain-containing protein [Siminovitchia terrae]RST57810.1 DUF896 domain-containing protein [Siminovitchia terrae]GIN91125.1 UPF0291 protein [Siminovitchia terrae]GIN94964.1 UPF0291 protein [Siminovitchia terrae]
MVSKEKLDRINQLAKKAKSTGLTKEEAKEQSKLRGEYLQSFRAKMRETIENVRVFDPNGDEVTPLKVRKIQENKKLH